MPNPSSNPNPNPNRKSKATILVVDDQPIFREGLTQLINRQPDMLVCGDVGNAASAAQVLETRRPDLVLLDEPSLGLAPIVVEEIFELILKIKRSGKTILLIEQNAGMALQVADRGYVLVTGEIALEGTGRELLVNPEVRKAYLGM